MEKIWLKHSPPGVNATIDTSAYRSLVELLDEGLAQHASRTACVCMGHDLSFSDIDAASRRFAAYLQSLGLPPGARVAVMLPNVPQYPVAVMGILRAGMVVVNVNPMYTPPELAHQLQDSGSEAIVVLENFAHTLQAVMSTTSLKHVVLASMGDMLGVIKGGLVNHVVRRVRKLVPHFDLPGAMPFNQALAQGKVRRLLPVQLVPEDVALLQYTGGTTGVSKGAMLTHRNVVASVLASEAWNAPLFRQVPTDEPLTFVAALPLYHIFGFAVNLMLGWRIGARNILIPDPRDLPAMFKALSRQPFHSFPAVNTLFAAMARHPDFNRVDWSSLRQSVGGGMAVQQATAKLWREKTGQLICEGYGLSETAGGVTCNPAMPTSFSGSIGMPLPCVELAVLDESGQALPTGTPGELAVRGPQVMAGYWRRPEDTATVMTPDGFLRTGDIGVMDERGHIKLIDRKKDMLKVSGFNVFPNEVEDKIALMPGVRECAVIGMRDAYSGEAVKLFIVRDTPDLTEQQVRAYCAQHLTGYKRPKVVVFVPDLPKTTIGKVLRRALRDEVPQPAEPITEDLIRAPSA